MAANQPQEEKPAEPNIMKEQDADPIGLPREAAACPGSFDHTIFPHTLYSPQAQQTFYYRGYENGSGEWDEYPPYLNSEGLEITSPGVYNENHPSLVYHSGYSYNPQMPYGPYSPVTTPMPSGGRGGQLYSPQQFPFSGQPYYQQVKLEQGIEMLNIFKNYETEMSILDDFDFYEDRQKAMQERKARQQASLEASSVGGENEHRSSTVKVPTDFMKHITKSFAQVVRLDEGTKEAAAVSDGLIGTRVQIEDALQPPIS